MAEHELFRRRALGNVAAALEDTRVVVLSGARQVGKSTLARVVTESHPQAEIRFLDDAALRAAARDDPASFVRHPGLLVIDEVQWAPELMLAIKHQVDLDPRPGRFILTGSARLWGMKDIPDLLPGRTETIELWPLSQGEIDRAEDDFVDVLFDQGGEIDPPPSALRRSDYIERALRGGYPEAIRRSDLGRRARFFESYTSDLVNRDIAQLSDISRPAQMRRLLDLVAARMATLLVPERWASVLELPASTVRRYLDLLELVYMIQRIPAWSTNLTTRAVATPKVLMIDSGLAGHLAGMTPKRAAHPTAPIGPLLENFVLGELARQLTWAQEPVRLYHYRDRDGHEVDAILERASGEVVALEVKAAETVRAEDFRGIRHLADRLGDQLVLGVVLYAGGTSLSFGPRLKALPMAALWSPRRPNS